MVDVSGLAQSLIFGGGLFAAAIAAMFVISARRLNRDPTNTRISRHQFEGDPE